MLANAVASALLNVALLAGIPFLIYFAYHRRRHGRSLAECAERAGLCIGKTRYLAHCAAFALVTVGVLVIWPPPLEPFLREGRRSGVGGLGLAETRRAALFTECSRPASRRNFCFAD